MTGRHKARPVMGAVSHVLSTIKLRTIHHYEISTEEMLERLQTGTGCKPGEYRPLNEGILQNHFYYAVQMAFTHVHDQLTLRRLWRAETRARRVDT